MLLLKTLITAISFTKKIVKNLMQTMRQEHPKGEPEFRMECPEDFYLKMVTNWKPWLPVQPIRGA